jgi:MFS family permease
MTDLSAPARFRWLPPGLRPDPQYGQMDKRQERTILLVGAAALFAGYDQNIFGLAIPQIQAELNIPENQVGLTVAYFRVAAVFAMLLAASADVIGRRQLLLITLFGQAAFTLFTAFAPDYKSFVLAQFLTRFFGYAEEMLCFVVIAEVVAAQARGWANGTLSAMYYVGAGLASLVFAMVNLLPYGWRAIYVIGALPIFAVAYLRRHLPETERFANREGLGSKSAQALRLVRDIARQYPRRVALVVIAASAFGFAISPATVLAQKFLQDTYLYSPGK